MISLAVFVVQLRPASIDLSKLPQMVANYSQYAGDAAILVPAGSETTLHYHMLNTSTHLATSRVTRGTPFRAFGFSSSFPARALSPSEPFHHAFLPPSSELDDRSFPALLKVGPGVFFSTGKTGEIDANMAILFAQTTELEQSEVRQIQQQGCSQSDAASFAELLSAPHWEIISRRVSYSSKVTSPKGSSASKVKSKKTKTATPELPLPASQASRVITTIALNDSNNRAVLAVVPSSALKDCLETDGQKCEATCAAVLALSKVLNSKQWGTVALLRGEAYETGDS
eukprot:gene9193-10847_t